MVICTNDMFYDVLSCYQEAVGRSLTPKKDKLRCIGRYFGSADSYDPFNLNIYTKL